MNLCFLGHYYQDLSRGDVGTQRVALSLAQGLSRGHRVEAFNIRAPRSWRRIGESKPQVLHFVLGPASPRAFLVMKTLALLFPRAKTVLSATLPLLSWRWLLPHLKPDLVLVQSRLSEAEFQRLGCRTRFLPNGVNTGVFLPVDRAERARCRKELGLEAEQFTLLHVGPLISARNVQLLARLQLHGDGLQAVVVGRRPEERGLRQALEERGCRVRVEYFPQMELVYPVADCYLFPTPPSHRQASIEMPLSVLEAMSCNLPVVTTPFGALPRVFEEGDGLFFASGEEGFREAVKRVRGSEHKVKTREKVLPYSWDCVCQRLEEIYEELLSQ